MQGSWTSLPLIIHSVLQKHRRPIYFLADADQAPGFYCGTPISAGDIVFYSSGTEAHRRTPANRTWAVMSLTPEDLAAASRALVGRELAAPLASAVVRPPPRLMARPMSLHKAACDLASSAPDFLAHREVAKAME
jgi:hypothetical protein